LQFPEYCNTFEKIYLLSTAGVVVLNPFRSICLFILSLLTVQCIAAPESDLAAQVREFLRQRIEAAGLPPHITIGEEIIYSSIVLPRFYLNRTFRPAWSDRNGPIPLADSLLHAIRESESEGLHPPDYHLEKIEEILEIIRGRQAGNLPLNHLRLVDLDLLLTDAFLVLGSHLAGGRVDPETFDPEWHPSRRVIDLAGVLEEALEREQIGPVLHGLLPNHPGYSQLREALARYRHIQRNGGWPVIPEGPTMRRGDSGNRVDILRERLLLAGDYQANRTNIYAVFDDVIEQAVIRFQERHGLEADGLVGRETLAHMNTPVEQRLRQVLVNMERWRWLPEDLGDRYIIVNIANFELELVERNETIMRMRVIVGRQYRRTPVFTGRMTYLVFSPFWNIPPGISANDILPQVKRNIGYLAENNIRVLEGWGANAGDIDPATVDWSVITARNNPYRFRQDPGPNNALGRVKFMFPNKFNVYLHDTPARELFTRVQRDFSSGCIRVEKPVELAEYLLTDRNEWNRRAIVQAMNGSVERTVSLKRPIPVHLLYWTAWADDTGTIHFRRDIYNRDQRLYEALHIPPPSPAQE
jgi:L,D-transpeptidase YcbB